MEPVGSFTGRKSQLDTLHNLLLSKGQTTKGTVINQSITISGLGGIGKSELARFYAWNYSQFYQGNAIWVDAETDKSLLDSLTALAKEHIPTYNDKMHRNPKTIFELIFKHFLQKPCLLILDNAEGDGIFDRLPNTLEPNHRKPTILITSRGSKWRHGVSVLPLGVLSDTEAIEFIMKRLKGAGVIDCTDKDIEKLITELQCLPLALQQAAAYIEAVLGELPHPILAYLKLFQTAKEAKELLSFKEGLKENEKTTLITWTVTMEKIETFEFGELAIRIMNLASFFEPDNIPIKIFSSWPTYKPGPITKFWLGNGVIAKSFETPPRISRALAEKVFHG